MFRSQVTLILRGVVLVATLMLSQQGVALAEQNPYSANYVMPGCRAFMKGVSLNSFKRGWCGGLITGLAQMHRRCMPPQLTQRQLASGIVQYIDAHPARMHEDFRNLAVEAMRVAWPCKPSKYRNIVRRRPLRAR
jgi:Rap1a immunity proteins